MNQYRVLYIDDEPANLNSFKAMFRRDFRIFTAESADEALKLISNQPVEVIVSDQRMPGKTGVEFFQVVKESHPDVMRILLTGYTDINAVIDAINKGQIYYYLTKPWDENLLRRVILNACELFELREENRRLTDELREANEQLEFMLRQKLLG
jgi:response regulator RpfG family c-di-GMP phosphodiesterase